MLIIREFANMFRLYVECVLHSGGFIVFCVYTCHLNSVNVLHMLFIGKRPVCITWSVLSFQPVLFKCLLV